MLRWACYGQLQLGHEHMIYLSHFRLAVGFEYSIWAHIDLIIQYTTLADLGRYYSIRKVFEASTQ